MDLQSEHNPASSCPDGTVYLTEDASKLPRVALGQQGAVDMQAWKHAPVSTEQFIMKPADTRNKEAEKSTASITSPCLEVVFDSKGDEKKVQIFQKPLGAEFSKKAKGQTKVSKIHPQSYAEKLGIEVGWILKSIGGEDVSQKTFQEAQAALKGGMSVLPRPEDVA